MKTKIIAKLMTVAIAFMAAFAAQAYQAIVTNGCTWVYSISGEEAMIHGIAGTPPATLEFPSELGGKPVRNLTGLSSYYWQESEWNEEGGYWSRDYSADAWQCNVTEFVLPETVTNITDWAFSVSTYYLEDGTTEKSGWVNLKHVNIPDSLCSCNVHEAFSGTPFLWSDTFPDFILSDSGKKLWGVKGYDGIWDFSVCPDVVIPATVTELADYALGCFLVLEEYEGEIYESSFSEGNVRIVFAGAKPKASLKTFNYSSWEDDAAWSGVYYKQSAAGWTFGEDWCGVKTYAHDEAPQEYAKKSSFKFGNIHCGLIINNSSYSEYELWSDNDLTAYGVEYAFIPVEGSGVITPVVFNNNTPDSIIGEIEVWTDKQMMDKFVPRNVSSNNWDDDDDSWEYEARKVWHKWPKSVWPEKTVVENRRWIVVPIKESVNWSGFMTFRVGIHGTSEISDSIMVYPGEDYLSFTEAGSINDFFHGMSIAGVEDVFPDSAEWLWGSDDEIIVKATWEFENCRQVDVQGKNMSFAVTLPSAGTLVMSSEDDDDDSPALKETFSITGRNILSDTEKRMSNDWESEDYRWGETNFWKASYAECYRRIEVSGGTTLTFFRKNREDADCEFNRMYFFPANARSVAIDVAYNSCFNYNRDDYMQGYVKGMGVYKSGETAKLTAIPGPGEEFDHWEVKFGNLELTEAQRKSPNLSFTVTDAMCGEMEEEEQIFIQAVWKPKCRVTALPSIVGAGTVTGSGSYYAGDVVTLRATAAPGCTFVKWSDGETSPTRTIEVVDTDVEHVIYACFEAPNGVPSVGVGDGGGLAGVTVVPLAASVYDSYLQKGNNVLGTIQAKVAKPKLNRKTSRTEAKVTVSIQLVGEKKITVKGEMDAVTGVFTGEAKDGRKLSLTFDMNGVSGDFNGIEVVGNRNLFSSKDKAEKVEAEATLEPWLGPLNMVCDCGVFTVTVAKKGKVTVKGTLDGAKVSAKATALIGEDAICIPVAYSKKGVNLAFTLWLPLDGGKSEVVGLNGAIVGKAGTLKAGAVFGIDGDIAADIPGAQLSATDEAGVSYSLLPDGESVSVDGRKWLVTDGAKAAKVKYDKKAGKITVTPGKKGQAIANASGLKLTYKAKDGSFKGSFYVYTLIDGRFKKQKATVTGVLIDGIGYGMATIKKIGSWSVVIE